VPRLKKASPAGGPPRAFSGPGGSNSGPGGSTVPQAQSCANTCSAARRSHSRFESIEVAASTARVSDRDRPVAQCSRSLASAGASARGLPCPWDPTERWSQGHDAFPRRHGPRHGPRPVRAHGASGRSRRRAGADGHPLRSARTDPPSVPTGTDTSASRAHAILDERFARGEIDEAEHRARRAVLDERRP
jgi:Short C-terminal domain